MLINPRLCKLLQRTNELLRRVLPSDKEFKGRLSSTHRCHVQTFLQLLAVLAGVSLALFAALTSKAIAADAPYATPSILAATPPMGWNSWNTFGENINEQVVKGAADKMVELGLKNLGYTRPR